MQAQANIAITHGGRPTNIAIAIKRRCSWMRRVSKWDTTVSIDKNKEVHSLLTYSETNAQALKKV